MSEDNPVSPETSTGTTSATQSPSEVASGSMVAPGVFSWKSQLSSDYANSPTMQKFSDDQAGFNEAVKSHLSLEQMLGHEKVPVPKGDFKTDVDGWNRFAKAMGVPDRAEQYGLPDVAVPESMKGLNFNKQEFAEMAHSLKLTPGQTKALWETYTGKSIEEYGKALKAHEEHMTGVVNRMRSEWGDAYDGNVELGQMVINKFCDTKEMQDYVTASLSKDPMGIKFLSKIGTQFAENKIGDFSNKRFSLSPDQAQQEIDSIVNDPKHPYNNERSSQSERDRAINYVNSLYAVLAKAKG